MFDLGIHPAVRVLPANKILPACEISHLCPAFKQTHFGRQPSSARRDISRPTRTAAHRQFRDRPFDVALQNNGAEGVLKAVFAAMQYVLVTRVLELLFRLQFHQLKSNFGGPAGARISNRLSIPTGRFLWMNKGLSGLKRVCTSCILRP